MVAHIFALLLAYFASKLVTVRFLTFIRFRNRPHFPSKSVILPFSNMFQRLTVSLKIDQFGHKICQKKRKDVSYQLLLVFFLKYFVVHEWSAVKKSFITYVWSKVDVFYCDTVYSMHYFQEQPLIYNYLKCVNEVVFYSSKKWITQPWSKL